jgi:hypothetical protein
MCAGDTPKESSEVKNDLEAAPTTAAIVNSEATGPTEESSVTTRPPVVQRRRKKQAKKSTLLGMVGYNSFSRANANMNDNRNRQDAQVYQVSQYAYTVIVFSMSFTIQALQCCAQPVEPSVKIFSFNSALGESSSKLDFIKEACQEVVKLTNLQRESPVDESPLAIRHCTLPIRIASLPPSVLQEMLSLSEKLVLEGDGGENDVILQDNQSYRIIQHFTQIQDGKKFSYIIEGTEFKNSTVLYEVGLFLKSLCADGRRPAAIRQILAEYFLILRNCITILKRHTDASYWE